MREEDQVVFEEYKVLGKTAKGAAAAGLIDRAIGDARLFSFSFLNETPAVQDLQQAKNPLYELLQIFAYGTYQDYQTSMIALPPLNPQQLTKLRLLSIISLASEHKVIPYDVLASFLDIKNIRELEDLVIEAIYLKIVSGKLDQKRKVFEVDFATSRDIRPGQLDAMIETLNNWCIISNQLIQTIDQKINFASQVVQKNKREKEAFDKEVEDMRSKVQKTPHDWEAKKDFNSAEYFEEDSRKGKSRLKFLKHGSGRAPATG